MFCRAVPGRTARYAGCRISRQRTGENGAMRAGEMPAVTLAGDVTMPIVGFGTWQLKGRSAYQSVRAALDAGYRHIDTATMYANEEEVGRAVKDSGLDRG